METTSRAEVSHAYTKPYLNGKRSRGSLYNSWLNLEKDMMNQNTAVAGQKNIAPDYMSVDIDKKKFQGCIGIVS